MIAELSDEQLRTLLSRLLSAESKRLGIPPAAIFVGGNQTAADGGVDASIAWTGDPEPLGWLPRRKIYFQCKAENMAAAALTKEIRPGGTARPIFAELAKEGGSYVVFSTDDPSSLGQKNRLAAMQKAIDDVADRESVHLDFYGADQIARWANQHPGVAIWVLEQRGRSMSGWRPWGPWSAPDSISRPYVFDETARAVVDGDEVDVRTALIVIRKKLASPGGDVRLVGISGMGKTRLAEALFDNSIDAATALDPHKAVYGDMSDTPATGPSLIAEELVLASVDSVIILDNANVRTHAQVAKTVSRPGSLSSLLSIDYDVGGEKPTGTIVVTLGDNSDTVLRAVLEQRCPNLSDAERRHLADFAGGNARIALKVAESSERGLDLSTLNDGELLDRLFQSGRQETDPNMRAAADAASLVYAFYVEAGDGQEAEHPVLANIAGIPPEVFFRHIATFLDWGVVQQRGPQRAVMPPPLANMLAAPFIRRSDPTWLLETFAAASARLCASFARRLGQLHNEPAAVRLAERLFADGGLLGDPANLGSIGFRAFVQAAPAHPEAALSALERSLAGPNAKKLLGAAPTERREVTHLIAIIAHDPLLFARCMEALLTFAMHEHGDGSDNQVQEAFLQRFWPKLSFTLATGPTRLEVIDRLLDDSNERVQALGIEALDHMLDVAHLSSSMQGDFGSRPRLTEWRPNGETYTTWVQAALDRLVHVASAGSSLAARARTVIAHHLREQLRLRPIRIIEAMRSARSVGYWEEGWKAAAQALHYERGSITTDVRHELLALELNFRPKTLEECFEAFVIGEPWRHYRPRETDRAFVRNTAWLAEAVGKRVASNAEPLDRYFDRAIDVPGYSRAWHFGRGLAKRTSDLDQLWRSAYSSFIAAEPEHRHALLLGGILDGAARTSREWVDERLDAAVSDPDLSRHLVTLHGSVPLDTRSVDRFTEALENGGVPPDRFLSLMMGSVTQPIPAPALAEFLKRLFAVDGGPLVAVQILHMRLFGDSSDGREIDPALIQAARHFIGDPRLFDAESEREDSDIAEVAKVALRGDGGYEAAVAACRALRAAAGDHVSFREFDQTCRVIMEAHPRAVLDAIVGTDAHDYLVGRFFGGYVRDDDDLIEAKLPLNEEVALAWVKENPGDRAPRLARFVPYAVATEAGAFDWGPFARKLIDLAPDPVSVLNAFSSRFWSGGGSGPIASRFVRRRPLAAAFMNDPDPARRTWARRASRELEVWIRRWGELDGQRDTRFE
jgi:hypothetical protein